MSNHFKYPRTPHLPWSPGYSADDVRKNSTGCFSGQRVIITEKMDGENTSLYRDGLHARSLDSRHHPSRNWVKSLHGQIAHLIPAGWRICGENLYARHSLAYSNLQSYFYGFSIWNEQNTCLDWQQTLDWFARLGLSSPPVLFDGIWDEAMVRQIAIDTEQHEGYVVRLADAFPYERFGESVAKWVRTGHVNSETHWMSQALTPNHLLLDGATGSCSYRESVAEQQASEDRFVCSELTEKQMAELHLRGKQ